MNPYLQIEREGKDDMLDQIEKNPAILVDYSDQNELNDVYRNLYALLREPVTSDQYQNAQAFLERHIMNAVQSYYVKNGEQAEREAREYHEQLEAA